VSENEIPTVSRLVNGVLIVVGAGVVIAVGLEGGSTLMQHRSLLSVAAGLALMACAPAAVVAAVWGFHKFVIPLRKDT
jgi:hypothetical protein